MQGKMKEKMDSAQALMDEILSERAVPKNTRIKIEESIKTIFSKKKIETVDLSNVVYILNDASNDPNTPVYIRTTIWELISALEEIKEGIKD